MCCFLPWIIVHCNVTPQTFVRLLWQFAVTHLYFPVKRGNVEKKNCLARARSRRRSNPVLFSTGSLTLYLLTPMSDQDWISPYNINRISTDKWWEYQTYITRTVFRTVRRIPNKILGVKGLKQLFFFFFSFSFFDLKLGVDPERFVPPRECE